MQEAATADAENIGLGYAAMKERNILWVLSRLKVVFSRQADRHTPMTLTTHSRGCDRIMAIRDYEFTQGEERIAYATSGWSLINFETHRIVRPPKDLMPGFTPAEETLKHIPGRVVKPEGEYVCDRRVLYSDIDLNSHMNNARYVEWAMDVFPCQWHEHRWVKEFEINYHAEVYPSQTLKLYRLDEEDCSTVYGEKEDGTVSFTCKIIWIPA